jgi:hypothetical protein
MKTVDWTILEHSYGEASNVPRILEALGSTDLGALDAGFYDLYGSLCHQGSVYSATRAAIPALVLLARSPTYPERARLFKALGDIAQGHGEGVAISDVRAEFANDALGLLESTNGNEEKLNALRIFAGPELASAAEGLERMARHEGSPVVRAAAWTALSRVAPSRLPDTVDDDEPAVALSCALSRLDALGTDAPSAFVDQVATRLRDRAALTRLRRWANENAGASPFVHCRAHLGHEGIFGVLCAELENAYLSDEATEIAVTLLDATFPFRTDALGHESTEESAPDVDLQALTGSQRAVLEAVLRSESVWSVDGALNGNLLYSLMRRGLTSEPQARASLFAALDLAPKRRIVIVAPRQVRGAREAIVALGREAWLDVPFVFMTAGVDLSSIPEDPDDFPEKVMDDYRVIRMPILAMVMQYTCPLSRGAFYPQISSAELEALVRGLGVEVVPPNLVFAEDEFDASQYAESKEDEGEAESAEGVPLPPCLPFSELSDATKRLLASFVDHLEKAGFSEVKESYASSRAMGEAGIRVTPIAMARRFGSTTYLEVGFHCNEEDDTFVRATFASKKDECVLVARFLGVGEPFFEALASADASTNPTDLLKRMIAVCECTLVEIGGQLLHVALEDSP